jgi:lipopolysaccharide transport system ATP-binding protein
VPPPAVIFDSVWKKFRRGEHHDSLRDLVPSLVRRLANKSRSARQLTSDQEFWALRGVSFQVQPGESLGIIGPNGAGKSTTLKLLTRILRPTSGTCAVRGRIGALIEIAAGFHPDLTGRENIYLQGAIMGMRRSEIASKLDQIIDFAGVSAFVDTPVKRYSSGMNARLGFAVAAHLDPDVLIIDEVLSVGDAAFQRRCVERMQQFIRDGVSVIFVSHDLQAVSQVCDRAVLLKQGESFLGRTEDVIAEYLARDAETRTDAGQTSILFTSASLVDDKEAPIATVAPGAALQLRAEIDVREPISDITLGFMVYRSTDHLIVYEATLSGKEIGFDSANVGRSTIRFDFLANLIRGHYHLECYVLHEPTHTFVSRLCPAAMFSVAERLTCRGVADVCVRGSVHFDAYQSL